MFGQQLTKIAGVFLSVVLPFSSMNVEAADTQSTYKPVIKTIINAVIVPGYQSLHTSASHLSSSIEGLCRSKLPDQWATVSADFEKLVHAWSAVELYRFGPAREDNRYEKLFFWPDRRSRGIKQVKNILRNEESTNLNVEELRTKSVAVQGILALEYALFGSGSEILNTHSKNNFRCRYAHAVSLAIEHTSLEVLQAWKKPEGYRAHMLNAGPENAVFKSDQEVIRDILQRASELIQSIITLKLNPALQETYEESRAKRAPFYRSNLFLPSLDANLNAILTLQSEGRLLVLLPEEDRGYARGLAFEIQQIRKEFQPFIEQNIPWNDVVASKTHYEKLKYILSPLKASHDILAEYYPQMLGITMGFNSLDGD